MRVIVGDCRDVLADIPNNFFDSVVCDPPYELGFMGKAWDSTGIAYDSTLWVEVLRVLKPGGHLLAFGGSRTYHRLACAVEDAGFEIRDQIMWVYGSGFPKSLNIGKQDGCAKWEGWGTALKPAHEPIVVARKPLEGTVAANVLKWGVGGLNIDGCRVERADGDDSHAGQRTDTFGTQETLSGGDGSGGWSQNDSGRWPANFIHDGSDEVLELFPDVGKSTGGRIGKKSMGNVTNVPAGKFEPGNPGYGDSGSAARFFYCAKAGKKERNAGLEHLPTRRASAMGYDIGLGEAGEGMFKDRNPQKQNHHPTVKPISLMRYLVRLVTPPNGTVFDPFTGSGTTGVAAVLEGNDFVGIEQNVEYAAIAEARIKFVVNDSR